MIGIGDRLPPATFFALGETGPVAVEGADFFGGRRVALFVSPGAFTPTDTDRQLPSFLKHRQTLSARGVDRIGCIAVNDVFVMAAWGRHCRVEGRIAMLADASGAFIGAAGLSQQIGPYALGVRARRALLLVSDGNVEAISVECGLKDCEKSDASHLLTLL